MATPAWADIITVGPGHQYNKPSAAARVARDGDMVEISAKGKYENDTAVWRANNLKIVGIDGRPKIENNGLIGNGKGIWVIKGDNTAIHNIEFSGAKVRDRNGAALRVEGTNLLIKGCYFHHNENGILTGKNPQSEINIVNSEFAHNGHGRGQTHNLYIGDVKKLRFVGNFSHHARIGHTLKSRAARNEILYNRLMDGVDGNSSYLIDLPNGGYSIVMGNVIQQSPNTDNWALLAYGMEGLKKKRNNKLYVTFNTFVNNRSSGVFLQLKEGVEGIAANNVFAGKGRVVNGELRLENNLVTESDNIFVDPHIFDYHLQRDGPMLNSAKPIKTAEGKTLVPAYQMGLRGLEKRKMIGGGYEPGAFEHWVY